MPRPGDLFGGYRIGREIGRGGMGVVYEAEELSLNRSVAIKVVLAGMPDLELLKARFVREAAALARVRSRHIVPIHAHGEVDGQLFFATELFPDGDLQRWLVEHGPLGRGDAVRLVSGIAEALEDAHRAGVIHRDVKPSNVLLWRRGTQLVPYLCDFGIATADKTSHTRTGAVIGSVAYTSPERHLGKAADERSDIYSLGCVLWAALSGDAPYSGTDFQVMSAHINEPPPQLGGPTEIETLLDSILRDLMCKDVSERIASAAEAGGRLRELQGFIETHPEASKSEWVRETGTPTPATRRHDPPTDLTVARPAIRLPQARPVIGSVPVWSAGDESVGPDANDAVPSLSPDEGLIRSMPSAGDLAEASSQDPFHVKGEDEPSVDEESPIAPSDSDTSEQSAEVDSAAAHERNSEPAIDAPEGVESWPTQPRRPVDANADDQGGLAATIARSEVALSKPEDSQRITPATGTRDAENSGRGRRRTLTSVAAIVAFALVVVVVLFVVNNLGHRPAVSSDRKVVQASSLSSTMPRGLWVVSSQVVHANASARDSKSVFGRQVGDAPRRMSFTFSACITPTRCVGQFSAFGVVYTYRWEGGSLLVHPPTIGKFPPQPCDSQTSGGRSAGRGQLFRTSNMHPILMRTTARDVDQRPTGMAGQSEWTIDYAPLRNCNIQPKRYRLVERWTMAPARD